MNTNQPHAKLDPQSQIQDVYLFEEKLREAIEDDQILPSRRSSVERTVFAVLVFLSVIIGLDFLRCLFSDSCTTSTFRMLLIAFAVAAVARLLVLRKHRRCQGNHKRYELFNRALRKFNIIFDDKSKKLLLLKQKNQRNNSRSNSIRTH